MINKKKYIDFIINLFNTIQKEQYTKLQYLTIKNIINNSISTSDWEWISKYQTLNEDFIKEFQDKVYWLYISEYQTLSEDFIREFQNKVDWYWISKYQTLSEDFIREFQDKVYWFIISECQVLSEEFIIEFQNEVRWSALIANENIPDSIKDKFKHKLK